MEMPGQFVPNFGFDIKMDVKLARVFLGKTRGWNLKMDPWKRRMCFFNHYFWVAVVGFQVCREKVFTP